MINKAHLFYNAKETYSYHPHGGGPRYRLPAKDRTRHGNELLTRLTESLRVIETKAAIDRSDTQTQVLPLSSDKGVFLSIVSDKNEELSVDKFDNRYFELKTLKLEGDNQVLTFYTTQKNQEKFSRSIQKFINEDTKNGNPKNLPMLNNISLIRASTLEDLWTDDLSLLPSGSNDIICCELWMTFRNESIKEEFQLVLNDYLYESTPYISSLSLPTVTVFKVESTRERLESLIADYPNVVELRRSSESPNVFIDMDMPSQHLFTEDFNQRINVNFSEDQIFVSILDTGVNYNNRLLSKVCNASYSTSWDPNWDDYSDSSISPLQHYHGSFQAGVAAFGANILDDLVGTHAIEVTHEIESGRILPPRGVNPKRLYGDVMLGTISNLVIERPNSKRVYSLAVTDNEFECEGYPTSWSAAIDTFCYQNSELSTDVFVISAGNASNVQKDYWTNARAAKIQNPAQAWNAITVGSCTKLYNVTNLVNPTICSALGDINPTTSSSHDWEWDGSPFKPEILCEGGNRVIDNGVIDFHEDLALLTASGKTQGNVFGSHTDTSAATAEASYMAAKIMAAYPMATAETIRGLIIHSAEWSQPILDELNRLAQSHPQKTVLKEYKKNILSVCGYGIPNLEKAINSKNNRLSLIIESSIKPVDDNNFNLNEFNIHDLPWPKQVLSQLPLDSTVKMTITLSYFIEPNPRVSNIKSKYVYRSHGLSFNLCKPGQPRQDFIESNNRSDRRSETYTEHKFDHGWFFGNSLQGNGCIHKDYWEGTAADLAETSTIVIKPVTGWWKLNKDKERCSKSVNYSLLVTLEVDDNDIDIYSEVENKINTHVGNVVPIQVSI